MVLEIFIKDRTGLIFCSFFFLFFEVYENVKFLSLVAYLYTTRHAEYEFVLERLSKHHFKPVP